MVLSTTAVVLGGSVARLCAAGDLAEHFDAAPDQDPERTYAQ